MLKKILILCLLLGNLTLLAQDNEYWLVDDYLKLNPNEKFKADNFIELVRKDAKVVNNQKTPINIVMVYPGNQVSDYWRRSKKSFERRLDALNIKYKLQNHFTKPGTIREQARHLMQAIRSDIDYLIFTMDAKKHSKFIEIIITKKKPKLILQNITTPLKKWGDIQPFLYVGFDHKIGSLKIADYYINATDGVGKYAVLYGTQGYVSQMRGDEFINYVSKKSDLKLIDSYYTNFNKEKAYNAAKEILKTHKNIKFIYACSTDIAHGAIQALKEENLIGKVLVNGWGGGSSELASIRNKEMDLTVMRINDDNGVAMAEAIKLDIEGLKKDIPLIFSGDIELIDQKTSQKRFDLLKFKSFRYSN